MVYFVNWISVHGHQGVVMSERGYTCLFGGLDGCRRIFRHKLHLGREFVNNNNVSMENIFRSYW